MAMALLPMLAGMGSQGQSQQDQALNQVNPSKDGQQQMDAQSGGGSTGGMVSPPQNNNQGGAQVLQMLAKMGQQNTQGGPVPLGSAPTPTQNTVPGLQTQTTGAQPTSTLGTVANGPANGSDFGQFLMSMFGQR